MAVAYPALDHLDPNPCKEDTWGILKLPVAPSGVILLGTNEVVSCVYYRNCALLSRSSAQYAPCLLVPIGTFDTCTSVDTAATFVNELEHSHASVVPMTDGVTILVSR